MKRLLFIAHRLPYPPDKGERVRAFNELKALAAHFRITVAALTHARSDEAAAPELRTWCEKVITGRAGGSLGLVRGALSLCAGKSVTEGYFRNRRLLKALVEEGQPRSFRPRVRLLVQYAAVRPCGSRLHAGHGPGGRRQCQMGQLRQERLVAQAIPLP